MLDFLLSSQMMGAVKDLEKMKVEVERIQVQEPTVIQEINYG